MSATCDICEAPATYNFQKVWIGWKIKDGDYEIENGPFFEDIACVIEEPTGGDNLHFCESCAKGSDFSEAI